MSNPTKLESEPVELSALAHQLNNSLLIIMGNLDLLTGQITGEAELELLEDALTATQDAADLVERIRALKP